MRTQLVRIIKRAGLKQWPKLFQNLRATRETELAEEFPMHVVCDWIGNSEVIAAKHYLQTTDEHFERATQAAQKAAHTLRATGCTGVKIARLAGNRERPKFTPPRKKNAPCIGMHGARDGRTGTRTWDLSFIRAAL